LYNFRFMKTYLIGLLVIFSFALKGQSLPATENVFIITLDGLRWQEVFSGADSLLITNKNYVRDPVGLKNSFWAETATERRKLLLPFFWTQLSTKGVLLGNRSVDNKVNVSNSLWFSYPGYNEILCGFSDDARIKANNKIDNPNTTVLEFLNKEPLFQNKVAAFASWDVFPFILNEQRSGIPLNAGFEKASDTDLTEREKYLNELQAQIPSPWESVRLDAFTHQYCLEYLKKHSPRVVYISYGETDDFAHDGKYDAYLTSAHRTDKFIQELWSWVQSQKQYKGKTTFIITTDHGRGTVPIDTWRNHGAETEGSDQIWIAAIGAGVKSIGESKSKGQYYQNQIASTVAYLLGVRYTNERPVGEVIDVFVR
jgi:hypothetical protein